MGDPSGHVYENKVFIYGKRDRRCRPDTNDLTWTCFSSSNLEHWTDHEDIFGVADIPWATGYAFAPDCALKNGIYYLYAPCVDDNGEWNTAIGTSDKPQGPFTYAGRIDLREIDPSTFIDDDGSAWVYYPAHLARLREDMLGIEGEWIPREQYLIGGPLDPKVYTTFENPFVFKRNGVYYYLLSVFERGETTRCKGGQSVYYWMGDTPAGPFHYRGCIYDPESGNCGSSIVEFQGRWIFFYHKMSHSPDVDCNERKPQAEWCVFNGDGTIQPMTATKEGLATD